MVCKDAARGRCLPSAPAPGQPAVPLRAPACTGTGAGGAIRHPVEREVLERFVDLRQGFARIYCDHCGRDYLLPFSCMARYFCPGCHQKRVPLDGEWIEDEVH